MNKDQDLDALVKDLFTYHPWDEEKVKKGNQVREALGAAYKVILEVIPPSLDRSTALRKIREARMDCNSALTFDGKY